MQLILIYLFSLVLTPSCDRMDMVREAHTNIRTESELITFLEFVDTIDCHSVVSYKASAIMQKAQFALAPWTKYRYFLNGKKMLEEHIKEYPDDLDARYVRFLVQNHVPFFLGYSRDVERDATTILNNIESSNIADSYKKQMLGHISEFYK